MSAFSVVLTSIGYLSAGMVINWWMYDDDRDLMSAYWIAIVIWPILLIDCFVVWCFGRIKRGIKWL